MPDPKTEGASEISPPQRLNLDFQGVLYLIRPAPNDINWNSADKITDPEKKRERLAELDQRYEDNIAEHRQQNIQMRAQLAENKDGETTNLFEQSLYWISDTRRQITEIDQQINQDPSNAFIYEQQKEDLFQLLIEQSTASGFIRAFLPPQ